MKSNLTGVLNYTTSNSKSLVSALEAIDTKYIVAKNFIELVGCDRIIIPGVGNMEFFFEENDVNFLRVQCLEYLRNGGLIYGICLGMQLLLDHSSEGNTKTLGLISGEVVSLKSQFSYELNVGHNELIMNNKTKVIKELFNDIDKKEKFYFLHKYHCINIDNEYVQLKTIFNNNPITALLYNKNILATQFHPELSGKVGLNFLKNFTLLRIK
jgi:imidazole glycerol phosphate synthase glutamine amidotransferase subunit